MRKLLGFSFTSGTITKRRLPPQTVARFKARVQELTRWTRGRSLAQIVKELSVYLTGWRSYSGFCETPTVLRALEQWTRRRLRAIAWKQWRRGRTRFAHLIKRGVSPEPPYTDPYVTVVWEGRRCEAPPYPDFDFMKITPPPSTGDLSVTQKIVRIASQIRKAIQTPWTPAASTIKAMTKGVPCARWAAGSAASLMFQFPDCVLGIW